MSALLRPCWKLSVPLDGACVQAVGSNTYLPSKPSQQLLETFLCISLVMG